MDDLSTLTEAIEIGDRTTAVDLTRAAVESGTDTQAILDAMTGAMEVVGKRFQFNEIFVPEMLVAARAMKESLTVLEPVLVKAGISPKHTAVIGTIKGDLHDIGKNLVVMMWKGANIRVVDLGTDVSPAEFVTAAQEHQADIVGVSALLTTTMVGMKDVVTALREAGLSGTKVVVGGAPVTREFAGQIGADAFATDAGGAVEAFRHALAS